MNFASLDFLWFFLAFYASYWLLPGRWRVTWLLAASYLFYAWWNWKFMGLLAFATLVGYYCGLRIHLAASDRFRKFWLYCSIVASLGVLGYFKYAGFFVDSFIALLNSLGFHADPVVLGIVLPVGISFFTFGVLTYTVDIYRRHLEPTRSLRTFAAFLAFFPRLVAGPIVRGHEFLGQLTTPRRFSAEDLQQGSLRFLLGFFKKTVIADNIAILFVDPVFSDPGRYDSGTIVMAVIVYTAQIYADFSGYTDMALGTARLLGFKLPENFRLPYLARSVVEFWTRWHMTMSRFFRDYVYISLGGSRKGAMRTRVNIMVTMLLSGLWHGAAWTYVIWGGLLGVGILVGNFFASLAGRNVKPKPPMTIPIALLAWSATLLWIMLVRILFRAPSLDNALTMLGSLVSPQTGESLAVPLIAWFGISVVTAEHLVGLARERGMRAALSPPVWLVGSMYAALLVLIVNLKPENPNPFIYFQF